MDGCRADLSYISLRMLVSSLTHFFDFLLLHRLAMHQRTINSYLPSETRPRGSQHTLVRLVIRQKSVAAVEKDCLKNPPRPRRLC